MFGGDRTPLSGSNSKQTSSDVIHPDLYIEVKHRKKIPFFKTWLDTVDKAEKEHKTPIVVIHEKSSHINLAIVDAEWLASILKVYE
jgi:uncharacterized circularly permuted ATP-grasp superfamily protein